MKKKRRQKEVVQQDINQQGGGTLRMNSIMKVAWNLHASCQHCSARKDEEKKKVDFCAEE